MSNLHKSKQYDPIDMFKADMKTYIPLETAAISFLANLFLKQDISSEYVMVDFICMGLLALFGTRTENYRMKYSCPQWIQPGTFRPQGERAKRWAIRADKYRSPKGERILSSVIFKVTCTT